MPINIWSTAELRNKLLKRQRWVGRRFWWTYAVVDIGYVFSGCHAMQSRDACCEGVWQKDIQFVMVDSWDICTTWNAHKEGGLMAITFFNSWIWITCIPLMVNICDKKRHLMWFILPYFHGKLIPIITPVTFDESHTKKCECLHRNMR